MNKNGKMLERLESVYCPVSKRRDMIECINFVFSHKIRDISKDDAGCVGVPMVFIEIAGRGLRSTFMGWHLAKTDFDNVGEYYANAYVNNGISKKPCRLYNTSIYNGVIY